MEAGGIPREQLHAMWATVAPSWGEHATYVDARAASVTAHMLERSAPQPGDRVLELACGAGGLGLAAAPLVAPGGEGGPSAVAPPMAAVAQARVARSGLDHIVVRTLDLEAIAEPDDSFDVVRCREGLMLVLDPALATREIRRVLRPGGRAVVSTWASRASNPWLGAIFDAVSAKLDMPMPPAGLPGPFALGDPGALADAFQCGGWRSVDVGEVPSPLWPPSLDTRREGGVG